MAKPRVGVVDYGMGNLRSVSKALEAAGASVFLADKPAALSKANLLVVPGQGHFGAAMKALSKTGLASFVARWIADDKPYLGICLGLQILFERSEESPGVPGLGVFAGAVKKFRPKKKSVKVPHMGWNQAHWTGAAKGDAPENFYFVHSYYVAPNDRSVALAETDYDGRFCAAAARGQLVATQFHPEKSGAAGQRFLKSVLAGL